MFGTNYAFSKLREKVNKTDWVSLKALLTRSDHDKEGDQAHSETFCW